MSGPCGKKLYPNRFHPDYDSRAGWCLRTGINQVEYQAAFMKRKSRIQFGIVFPHFQS